jgi:DNA-directed RNA polymerase subunit RPC12/RpoP
MVEEVFLQCTRCGSIVPYGELKRLPYFACPACGFRVLKKMRPRMVKILKGV